MIGYFEGIDSERGIAWRTADWLALRKRPGAQARRAECGIVSFAPFPVSSSSRIANLPLFWRFQLGGWAVHAIVTMPLKVAAFGGAGAFAVSLGTEPLGFALTVGLRHAYQRLGLRVGAPYRLVLWVLACSTVASVLDWLIARPVQLQLNLSVPSLFIIGFAWLRAVQYVGWSGLYFGISAAIAERQRALNLVRAEAAARESELQMLRAQINPHFLFNSLNTVLAGLDRDPKALGAVVQGLADYLRYSLAHRHMTMVPLGEEFDAAVNYLIVEKARFRGDLEVETHIDPAARGLPVPGVMLQPLIENAVKHGYTSSPIPLRLRVVIRASVDGGGVIEVANSGRWVEPRAERASGDASGFGLDSVTRRLQLLYPRAHRFEIDTGRDEVSVRIHLSPAAPAGTP